MAANDLAARDGQEDRSAKLARLLQRCGGGDRAAFRLVYDLEAPRLYGLALRMTRQSELAADAVHDALLQVWQNAARFDPARGAAEAWLTSLVRYRALDIARKQTKETSSIDTPEEADDTPDPLERLLTMTAGDALRHCLQTLDQPQRRAIILAFVEGLSHAQLAKQLGAPVGTVKSWIRRSLIALKACLES